MPRWVQMSTLDISVDCRHINCEHNILATGLHCESSYREAINNLGEWCTENNLLLNVVVDFRKKKARHPCLNC